ncbi:uncharacterized protein [Diadema setosum]|uniref:uncharacterized protein n=1 Tax=Diadema setosum TaxID=31175 RepID=UPI003B3B8DC3
MGRIRRHCCSLLFLFKVCVLLLAASSVMLLFQSVWSSNLEHSHVGKAGHLAGNRINSAAFIERDLLPKLNQDSSSSECSVPRFKINSTAPANVVCRRITPRPGSCQLAHDLYIEQKAETCSHQEKYKLCQIKGEGKDVQVDCDQRVCPGPVSLGTINPALGILHWEEFADIKELQVHLQHLLLTAKPEAAYGFCFIKCPVKLHQAEEGAEEGDEAVVEEIDDTDGAMDMDAEMEDDLGNSFQKFEQDYFMEENDEEWAQQLLLLPLSRPGSHPPAQNRHSDLNINVILLDSVSHSHFYRSLPRTVQTLRKISEQEKNCVFNFNLMQSLKGRTYENLQMLFSGTMYNPEKPFGVQEMPPDALNTRIILEGFKQRGYETLWMEDLCWTWEWGIAKNFVVHSPKEMLSFRWQKLNDAMKTAGIDQMGLALANCEILHHNGHNDPFHGPPAICYNGEYQHAYMLDYLIELQLSKQRRGVPYFHYTELNVAHDDHGVRVQNLDSYLADYLKLTLTQENTMTIILADHGNSYGSFIQKTEEGRIEMFHPALFVMLSHDAGKFLSPSQLSALQVNQDRLVSILDIHYMLRYLSYPGLDAKVALEHRHYDAHPMGLLRAISPNRTCDHIPRIQPNVCICENYDSRVPNDTSRVIFAEFALGELNNAIQNQFVEAQPQARTGFGRCQPLQALWFANVRENYHGEDAVIKLDLYTKAGRNATQQEEIFFVTMMMSLSKSSSTSGLRLMSYERLTAYSQYGKCADSGVATKLCVCSLATSHVARESVEYGATPIWHNISSFYATRESVLKAVTKCLHVYERRTQNGVVLEASCECRDKLYLVEVSAKSVNVIPSRDLPVKEVLKPGMRTFLIAFMQKVSKSPWSLEYSLAYSEHDVAS